MMVALTAQAQVEFVKDGLKYTTIDSTSVKVGKISDKRLPKGKLVIPGQVVHDGRTYIVTALAGWGFFGCRDITEIKLPSTLKKIDIWALCRCEKLKEIKREGWELFGSSKRKSTFRPASPRLVIRRLRTARPSRPSRCRPASPGCPSAWRRNAPSCAR